MKKIGTKVKKGRNKNIPNNYYDWVEYDEWRKVYGTPNNYTEIVKVDTIKNLMYTLFFMLSCIVWLLTPDVSDQSYTLKLFMAVYSFVVACLTILCYKFSIGILWNLCITLITIIFIVYFAIFLL